MELLYCVLGNTVTQIFVLLLHLMPVLVFMAILLAIIVHLPLAILPEYPGHLAKLLYHVETLTWRTHRYFVNTVPKILVLFLHHVPVLVLRAIFPANIVHLPAAISHEYPGHLVALLWHGETQFMKKFIEVNSNVTIPAARPDARTLERKVTHCFVHPVTKLYGLLFLLLSGRVVLANFLANSVHVLVVPRGYPGHQAQLHNHDVAMIMASLRVNVHWPLLTRHVLIKTRPPQLAAVVS